MQVTKGFAELALGFDSSYLAHIFRTCNCETVRNWNRIPVGAIWVDDRLKKAQFWIKNALQQKYYMVVSLTNPRKRRSLDFVSINQFDCNQGSCSQKRIRNLFLDTILMFYTCFHLFQTYHIYPGFAIQ